MKELYTLTELRLMENNKSRATLAEELGVTERYIGMLENGERTPSYNFLCSIAEHFGISIDQIKFRTQLKTKSA
jgi:transcriptional regulator with XRE-family HTH domain